jgi:hypothetical protein
MKTPVFVAPSFSLADPSPLKTLILFVKLPGNPLEYFSDN